jgi:CheY-like chemotaxis protein
MNFNSADIIANPYMMSAKTILLVEDDDSIREFVGAFFEDEGYAFATAVNGLEALKIVARLRPALILLDMYMPLMDGRAFAAAYRELPGPHAPLIGMSANVPDEELPSYFEGFLVKPFDLGELISCVERYLQ